MKPLSSFSNRLTEIKNNPLKSPRSERGELIGLFLERLNNDRLGSKYKPLTAARVGMMLRFLKTPDLRAFFRECEYAGNFSKFFWWRFKEAKNTK